MLTCHSWSLGYIPNTLARLVMRHVNPAHRRWRTKSCLANEWVLGEPGIHKTLPHKKLIFVFWINPSITSLGYRLSSSKLKEGITGLAIWLGQSELIPKPTVERKLKVVCMYSPSHTHIRVTYTNTHSPPNTHTYIHTSLGGWGLRQGLTCCLGWSS